MIKVFIIDDHLLIALGLKLNYKNSRQITIIGYSCRVDDAISKIHRLNPNIIILDLFLQNNSPICVFRSLSKEFPSIPIIILTGENGFYWKARMMKEGASGYLIKEQDNDYFTDTILEVAAGNTVTPLTKKDHNGYQLQIDILKTLHQDDFDLILSLSNGLTPKEISRETETPYSTINHRLKCLLNLFGAKTIAELIRVFFVPHHTSSFIIYSQS